MKEKIHTLYENITPYLSLEGRNKTPVPYLDVCRIRQILIFSLLSMEHCGFILPAASLTTSPASILPPLL